MLIYAVTLGALAGISLGLLFGVGAMWVIFAVAGIVVIFLSQTHLTPTLSHIRRGGRSIPIIAIALAAASLGAVRTIWHTQIIAQHAAEQAQFYDKQAVVEGTVSNDPAHSAAAVRATIDISNINTKLAHGSISISLPANTPLIYGDKIKVRGLLQAPQPFDTPQGRVFDYPHYLETQGITSVMMRATLLSRDPAEWSLTGALFSARHIFEQSLERSIPEPSAALLEGIELGDKNTMPKDLNQAFISSSLVHMVVLSGYNLSIVSEAVLRILSFLPQAAALSVGGFGMILFAIMTGGGAATIRALIMGIIAILARYFGRSSAALRALAFATGAMALWNPTSVLYDPSFILSVLATFGLITLSPTVEERLKFIKNESIRSIAASTISVQIFVLPALLYFTGIFSLVAIPANLLALPIVPSTMLAGFITGLCGLIGAWLATIPALASTTALKWIILVATTAAGLPLATLSIPAFSAWIVAAAYIPLTWWAVRVYKKTATYK